MVCFTCGVYGHAPDACPTTIRTQTVQVEPEEPCPNQVGAAPFGAWMIAPGRKTRAGMRRPQRGQVEGQKGGVGNREGGVTNSRFGPLMIQGDAGENLEAEEVNLEAEAANGEMPVSNAGEVEREVWAAAPNGGRERRPNVIANERQILNDHNRREEPRQRVEERPMANRSGSQRNSRRQTDGGSHAQNVGECPGQSRVHRRAAEEEEHVVVRGSKGGLNICTRTVNPDLQIGCDSQLNLENTGEHHSDEPDSLDEDGDAVMEVDDAAEGRAGGRSENRALIWNCQGAGGRNFQRILQTLLKNHKPDLIGLVEPRVSGDHANDICSKLGFDDWVRVEAIGFSGGIWVLWNKPLEITVEFTHPQFILLQVKELSGPPWVLAVVYASPTQHLRRRLWSALRANQQNILHPWLAAGDFNTVTCCNETLNYTAYNAHRSADFVDWIQEEGLVDLGFVGPQLTWVREADATTRKGARLDRALCDMPWRQRFPEAEVRHLPRIASDHTPLLIQTEAKGGSSTDFRFRFQAAWMTNDSLSEVVNRAWHPNEDIVQNIQQVQAGLTEWNKNVFGSIEAKKRILLARIGGIQKINSNARHKGLVTL
ncbi:PREDICTED: uncharacterized protein LOC109166023 [Ipomoea nil]|uniref:uncharacterized protein LOC109166023 n=1 Tax=Ipomoea nil TaxID=35883 RepID=UPI000900DFE6|nr:PREDICTED: uncharacterized protein LOC109166023 [Ipomoea nil]